jgi:epoxyqueuosine reductase
VRCLEACPTGALVEPYALDATRCLSYVTIESRETVSSEMRATIDRQVYGCDICQDVCPWNRRAATSDDPAWQPREGLAFPALIDLCRLSDDAWRALLKGSAMRRAGLKRVRRSLAYAAAHLAHADAAAALDALEAHPSSAEPQVADALSWSRETLVAGAGRP